MQAVQKPCFSLPSICHSAGEKVKAVVNSNRWYTVATVTTTVAMTVFLHSNPLSILLLSTSTLASGPIIRYTARVFEQDATKFNRALALTSLIVSSSALTVLAIYGLEISCLGLAAMTTLDLPTALNALFIGSSLITSSGRLATEFHQLGLWHYAKPTWVELNNFINNPLSKEPLTSVQRLFFPLVALNPQAFLLISSDLQSVFSIDTSLFDLSLACMSKKNWEKTFEELINRFDEFALHSDFGDLESAFDKIIRFYVKLPKELQDKYFEQLFRSCKSLEIEVPKFIENIRKAKAETLIESLPEKIGPFRNRFEALKQQVDILKNESEIDATLLETVSKELNTLRNETGIYYKKLNIYFIEEDKKSNEYESLTQIIKDLTNNESEILTAISTLNSKVGIKSGDLFDRDEDTWNYFLTDINAVRWKKTLQDEFDVESPDDLDRVMVENGITPLGTLIDNVLQGDTTKLGDKEELWELIKVYLSKKHPKPKKITKVDTKEIKEPSAGVGTRMLSRFSRMVHKVFFRAILILKAVTPMIVSPRITALGVVAGIAYRRSSWRNNNIDNPVNLGEIQRKLLQFLEFLGTRPTVHTLTNRVNSELRTYQEAHFFDKAGIVAYTLIPAFIQSEVFQTLTINRGFSLGNEITDLSERSYNYVRGIPALR